MQAQTRKRRDLFEGWQAGVVAIGVAAVGMLLGVPRAVTPTELPLPVPRQHNLELAHATNLSRGVPMATRSQEQRIQRFDQRRVGDAIRRFGAADVARDEEALVAAKTSLIAAVQELRALPDGNAQLLELFGYQLAVFLRELSAWQATGAPSRDLDELAGSITATMLQSGWVVPPRRIVPDEHVRAALFQKRFAEITGSRDLVGLNVDQHRVLLAFLIQHPPVQDNPITLASYRARRVEEAGQVDPEYPVDLARAIVRHQAGDLNAALEGYRRHFELHPDGPYTLRARNYVKALESP